MNTLTKLLIGSAGTSAMTLFSLGASVMCKQNFSEPAVLGILIKNQLPANKRSLVAPLGWASHYLLGNIWQLMYQYTMQKANIRQNIVTALLFGMLSGGIGVVCWRMLFKINPKRIDIDSRMFLMQLFMAHIVYFISSTALSNKLKSA